MIYTVKDLAKLAGVSSRTLRYYDQIGLLPPARTNSAGYRLYTQTEVDRLQQILFYREMGMELSKITQLLNSPNFNPAAALEQHLAALRERQSQINLLIHNAATTLAALQGRAAALRCLPEENIWGFAPKGEKIMQDKEKFEGFKTQLIQTNETAYGEEIRNKYGDAHIDAANQKVQNMGQTQYTELTALTEKLNDTLARAFAEGNPASPLAQEAAALHKQWLCFYWPEYSSEAHKTLAQAYVDDPRFTAYYNKIANGSAPFLRDAIFIYCK